MSKIKIALIAIVALVLGVVFGAMFAPTSNNNLGSVRFIQDKFVAGLTAGTNDELSIGSDGVLTTSAGIVNTGAVTGTNATFTGRAKIGSTASSTIQIGAASKSGCLILGDSANGANVVYIIATGSTITASTTKPAACQTVQ